MNVAPYENKLTKKSCNQPWCYLVLTHRFFNKILIYNLDEWDATKSKTAAIIYSKRMSSVSMISLMLPSSIACKVLQKALNSVLKGLKWRTTDRPKQTKFLWCIRKPYYWRLWRMLNLFLSMMVPGSWYLT